MLKTLSIRNFVTIESLHANFSTGLTVITGETGAGKSLLLAALELILGGRTDAQWTKGRTARAEIEASFHLQALPVAQQWLSTLDLDEDSECIVRRTLQQEKGSKAYINGRQVTLTQLRALGRLLMSMQGQQQSMGLKDPEQQRAFLDRFAKLEEEVEHVEAAYSAWKDAQAQWHAAQTAQEQRVARQQLLSYQVDELLSAAIDEGEFSALENKRRRYDQMERMGQAIAQCQHWLSNEEHGVLSTLQRIESKLQPWEQDQSMAHVLAYCQRAQIELFEAQAELQHSEAQLAQLDEEAMHAVDERLTQLHDLARKHQVAPQELMHVQMTLQEELKTLQANEKQHTALEEACHEKKAFYLKAARQLFEKRKASAPSLSHVITEKLHALGMPQGQFEVSVVALEEEQGHEKGCDRVRFLLQANPGIPSGDVGQVASGGEMSRLYLALQSVTAITNQVACLVFDEADSGVSGAAAEAIGQLLVNLGRVCQVICITHLPQVAVLGDHHWRVVKDVQHDTTRTDLQFLAEEERIRELARLLGGREITPQTKRYAHALWAQRDLIT